MANSKGVFVWRWNRVDEKIWKKNKEEKYFGGCLVEKGRGENDGGAYLSPQKSFLFKIERKLGGGKILYVKDKNAHIQVAHGLLQYVCLFVFFVFLYFCFCFLHVIFFFYKWLLLFNKFGWLYAFWLFVTFLFQLAIIF